MKRKRNKKKNLTVPYDTKKYFYNKTMMSYSGDDDVM